MTISLLSVDTAYDPALQWFENGRKRLYDELGGGHVIMQLGFARANRVNMLKVLNSESQGNLKYHSVVISSHGLPGMVLDNEDSPNNLLLSENDSEEVLSIVAKQRKIYICACEVAKGNLLRKLVELGSEVAIGFRESPKWTCDEGRRFWRDIDLEFVKCALFNQDKSAILRAQEHFLDRINKIIPYSGTSYKKDLKSIYSAISSMEIVSK